MTHAAHLIPATDIVPAAEPAIPHDRHAGRHQPGRRHLRRLAAVADGSRGRQRRGAYARGRCATIAVDKIAFLEAVKVGDEVSVYAELVSTGRTSMRFAVSAWRRRRDGEEVRKVTGAIFTFVALDLDGRPREIRPLVR